MRKIYCMAAVLLCLTVCGCSREYSKDIFAMDTVMNLKIYSGSDTALNEAESEIKRIDALLDRGNEES